MVGFMKGGHGSHQEGKEGKENSVAFEHKTVKVLHQVLYTTLGF